MTQTDDRANIRSAQAEEAEIRRLCREGSERYQLALIAAGYLTVTFVTLASSERVAA
jgi:fructose-1,6-bisphosphatase/inositol monophosphatase family enzyme